MPKGKGTYGSKRGRPPKKSKRKPIKGKTFAQSHSTAQRVVGK